MNGAARKKSNHKNVISPYATECSIIALSLQTEYNILEHLASDKTFQMISIISDSSQDK